MTTTRQPTLGPTVLDWSGRDGVRHWGGGRARPCRSCPKPALLVDDRGAPQHKVCAEAEIEAAKTSAARTAKHMPQAGPAIPLERNR